LTEPRFSRFFVEISTEKSKKRLRRWLGKRESRRSSNAVVFG
jgi:hypothetical protein